MKMNKHFTKKLLSIMLCLALVLSYLPVNIFAVENEKTVLDITKGDITINADSVSGFAADGTAVTTHDPDGYIIQGNGTATGNVISVTGGTHSIDLNEVIIGSDDQRTNGRSPLTIADNATVTLNLVGENTLGAGWDGYHTVNIVVGNGAALNIDGSGSLSCNENISSSKLKIGTGGTVEVKGGTVTLRTTPKPVVTGSGVFIVSNGNVTLRTDSGSYGRTNLFDSGVSVTISGGTVTQIDNADAFGAASFELSGGTVIFNKEFSDLPRTNLTSGMFYEAGNLSVYGNQTLSADFEVPSGKSLTVTDGATLTVDAGVTLTNQGTIQNNGSIIVSPNATVSGTINGNPEAYQGASGNIDVSTLADDLRITATGYTMNGKSYLYEDNYTLTGTTSHGVIFEAGDYQLTANDLHIVRENIWGHCAIALAAGAELQLDLADGSENTLTGGQEGCGIWVKEGASLIISGNGTLDAGYQTSTNMAYGAAIGGRQDENFGTITIKGGTIRATGTKGASIGSGNLYRTNNTMTGTIVLNGGTIYADLIGNPVSSGAVLKGSGAKIYCNSVRADTSDLNEIVYSKDGTSATVYGNATLTDDFEVPSSGLTVPSGTTLTIPAGKILAVARDRQIVVSGTIVNNGKVKADCTLESYFDTLNITIEKTHVYNVEGECSCSAVDPMRSSAFTVTGIGDYSWNEATGVLTITGSSVTVSNKDKNTATSHRIYIQGTANVTLDGVNIETGSGAPIEIRDHNDTNVTLTLSGTNTLVSKKANKAAIHKTRGQQGDNSAAATLTINGSGSLTAIGGSNAAGIGGGGYRGDTHNIIINSGTISATGKGWAAGIGSSNDGSTWNIVINGGNVTASGDPGIGANTENWQGVKDAAITGGMVITTSYRGSTPTGGLVSTDSGKTYTVYSDYTLSQDLTIASDGKLTVAEGAELTVADGVTLTNNGVLVNDGTISGSAIKTGLTENRVTISGVPEGGFVFDGNAHEPTVKFNDVPLIKGTDYTVIFSNSSGGDSITNVGTITMTIVGMGNYAGTVTKTYTIVKGNITPSVTLDGWKYGENAKTPVVTGNIGNGAVTYLYKVKGADDSTYTSTIPTNAGSYTVKAVIAESDNCYAAAATADFVIAQTEAKVETAPGAVDNLAYNGSAQTLIVAGTTNDGTMRYSLEENGPYLPELPKATAAGTYKVWYTVDGDANHTDGEVAYIEVTIDKADPGIGTVTAGVIKDSVEVSAIVLTRANTTVEGTLSVNAGQTLKLGNNQIAYTFTPSDTANYKIVTGTVTVTVADTIAPTGKVTVSNKSWTEFLNTITFGLFFKETQTVTVEATDNFSGVAKIEYYESTDALGLDAVKALASEKWTEMDNGKVTVTAVNAKQFIYYIRITDKSGNIAYLSTNGAEFDTSAPVISGVDDGVTYYTTQTVTVTDKNLNTVTLNGKAVTGTIALEGNKEATYTIVATDKVGNSTTVTVKIAPISDIAESVEGKTDTNVTSDDKANLQSIVDTATELLKSEDLTPAEKTALEKVKADAEELLDAIEDAANATDTDNTSKVENVTSESVTPEDKTDLEKAKTDLEKALEANGGNYTEAEKKAIEDEIKRIDDALKVVENVETVETAISKLPATVEPDDEENVAKIEAAKKAYDALSAYEKSLVGKQTKETLDKLAAAAVAYDIIKGDGSEWTQGAEDSITFTANGLFSKFSGVKVDGQIVDAKHYEAKAGSTIITLKASYLETLTAGEHTIAVVYTDGETAGTFEIEAKSVTPETGDHSNVVLWSTALLISVLAAAVLVIGRKRFV